MLFYLQSFQFVPPEFDILLIEDVIMTFEGRPVPPEDLELMKRLLRGGVMKNEIEVRNLFKNDALTKRLMNQAYDYGFVVINNDKYKSQYTPAAVNPHYKTIVLIVNGMNLNKSPFNLLMKWDI